MSRPVEHLIDELPELQSDADVDALMGRLRARIDSGPAARCAPVEAGSPLAIADGLGDLLAAQEALASTVVRAMTLLVDTLEEVAAEGGGSASRQTPRGRRTSRSKGR